MLTVSILKRLTCNPLIQNKIKSEHDLVKVVSRDKDFLRNFSLLANLKQNKHFDKLDTTWQSLPKNSPGEPPDRSGKYLVDLPSWPGEPDLSLTRVSVETKKYCILVVFRWNTEILSVRL